MQRYSNRAFPAYCYTPSENPHPTISPQGHSYDQTEESCVIGSQQALDLLTYGIDLLNHGYFWECHEMCEYLWKLYLRHPQYSRQSREPRVLQAIILLAVAQLHARRSKPTVAMKVAKQGLNKLQGLEGVCQGVPIVSLRTYLQTIIVSGELVGALCIPMH